jgi:hypothetical protein
MEKNEKKHKKSLTQTKDHNHNGDGTRRVDPVS